MKKAKSVLSLLLAFLMLFNLTVLTSAESTPTLSVTANVTEFNQGAEAAKVVYTVKLNPNGTNVAAFQFTLTAPEGMTLATGEAESEGSAGYWLADLMYHKTYNETAPFTTFEYAPTTGYFGASGGIAGRTLDSEATIMTITATVDTSAAKTYTLGVSGFICYAVGSTSLGGDTPTVDTVTVKASTVAVTDVTLDKSELSLDLKNNTTGTLTATVVPSNATDKTVTWSSSNDSVATVDNGVVTAVAVGEATITAKAGDQTATCAVTVVNCLHTYGKTTTEAKDSNCKVQGWDKYSACNVCGQKFDASGAEIDAIPYHDLAAHNFTDKVMNDSTLKTPGNCTTKAVYYYSCTVCGEKGETTFESEFGAHNLTKTEAKDATCTADGNNEYWTCGTCHKVFKEDKTTVTTVEAETIAAHHTLSYVDGKAATCTLKGEKEHYNCSACGKNFEDENGTKLLETIEIPAKGHTYESVAEKAATCCATGMRAHYQCKVCHAYFDADKNPVVESNLETDINPNNHAVALTKTEAKAATCTEAGNDAYWTCGSCHKLFSDAEGNTETTAAAVTVEKLGHKMDKTEAKVATCTEAGNNEYYTCSRCSKVFEDAAGNTETTVDAEKINALGHKMTKTEAKAATCTEDGYEAYWTCSACDKMFSDAEGKTEIAAKVPVTKLGHAMTHHVRVEATCQKTGMNEYYECSRCKGLFRDSEGGVSVAAEALVIAKIPHDYKGIYNETHHWQFCTACGATTTKALHDFTVDETTGTKTCNCGYVVYGEGSAPCDQHETKLVFDETHHWHVCEHCSYAEDKVAHDFGEWETDVEATATTDGLRHRTCKECSYVQQEVIAKPSTTPDRPNHRPSGGSATSSDKVQSSKTFDAGIAAYVGLSVLSLTGSALVIGKKKEF